MLDKEIEKLLKLEKELTRIKNGVAHVYPQEIKHLLPLLSESIKELKTKNK